MKRSRTQYLSLALTKESLSTSGLYGCAIVKFKCCDNKSETKKKETAKKQPLNCIQFSVRFLVSSVCISVSRDDDGVDSW